MTQNMSKPFNDLPPLPPRCNLETPAILKKVIKAHRQLAELKRVSAQLPNQGILIQSIGLQEAKASSEVENIVTTNDALYQSLADDGKSGDPHTKEVYRYHAALWFGYQAITQNKRLLSPLLFEELAALITGNQGGIRKLPGTHLKNPETKHIVYTPPEGEEVIRAHLERLIYFIYQEKDLDPLIRMALVHYQFEAIHPFYDGNGRTGRILNILMLIAEEILELPILYLSKYVIDHKAGYYNALNQVTQKQEWEQWVLYMLEAISETSRFTEQKILAMLGLMQKTRQEIQEKLPRIYSDELVDILFERPYCKIKFLGHLGHRQTVSQYLQELEKIGILSSVKKGREIYYIFDAYLKLLT